MTIKGTAGNDTLSGTDGNDVFLLTQGGDDTVSGLGGTDVFDFGATFPAADRVDGGAGADTLSLDGDYSAGITFSGTSLRNVETIAFAGTFTYLLNLANANVAAGQTLTVNGSKLAAGGGLDVNAARVAAGALHLIGGGGNDFLRGGGQADLIDLRHGGTDRADGNGGDDTILAGALFTARDRIDGGAGNDTLALAGDYTGAHTLAFTAATLDSVETLRLSGGSSYDIRAGALQPFGTLTVDAHTLGAGDTLAFDGTGATGAFHIIGGAGDDHLIGGDGGGTFDLSHGGDDFAQGGTGNDIFLMGDTLDEDDFIDGGGGTNTVIIDISQTRSGELDLDAGTLTNIQNLVLTGNHGSYVEMGDGAIAPGETLTVVVDNSRYIVVDAGDDISGGAYDIIGGAGHDVLRGGAGNDSFTVSGRDSSVFGADGDDTMYAGASLKAANHFNGGNGDDLLVLDGGAPVVFGSTTITNVETLRFDPVAAAGYRYQITTANSTIHPGLSLTIDASALPAGNGLTLDGSAEQNGHFLFKLSAGDDVVTGGAVEDSFDLTAGGNDSVTGGGAADSFLCGPGTDTFNYNTVSDSSAGAADTIAGFDGAKDLFHFANVAITGVFAVTGFASAATFALDVNLQLGGLAGQNAILFTAAHGDLAGQSFLIVDANGNHAYDAGTDYLIDLASAANMGSFGAGNFV